MLLFIIRHGDPIYNPDTLTPKGKLQAAAMGKRLAVHGIDRVFASPNGRARETAPARSTHGPTSAHGCRLSAEVQQFLIQELTRIRALWACITSGRCTNPGGCDTFSLDDEPRGRGPDLRSVQT